MSSQRESILAKLAAQVKAAPAIAPSIERSRLIAFSRKDGLSVWLEPIQDTPQQNAWPNLDWRLQVRFGIIARGLIPDQVADPVMVNLHDRVMADPTLGGLSFDLQAGPVAWQMLDADTGAVAVTVEFTVLYRTTQQSIGTP